MSQALLGQRSDQDKNFSDGARKNRQIKVQAPSLHVPLASIVDHAT